MILNKNSIWLRYAKVVRERYAIMIIATLIIALAIGLVTSEPGQFIKRFNVALIAIMIGAMGFTMTFGSVWSALKRKCGSCITLGLLLNFLFAPLLCWALAAVFLSDQPDFAVGLILIGAVPCAGMALVWTGLLKGDVPIATVINVLTMVIAPFLIPFIMFIFAGEFVDIDIYSMFLQILVTVLIPLLVGITARNLIERRIGSGAPKKSNEGSPNDPQKMTGVKEILPLMPAISATMAVLLMFMAINTTVPLMVKNLESVFTLIVSTVLIFPILFIVSYAINAKFLDWTRNIAMTYSAGMKNLPIAIGIASVSFGGLVMLPIAIGFAFQMMTAVVFYQLFRRKMPDSVTT